MSGETLTGKDLGCGMSELVYGDVEGFEEVTERIVSQSRWMTRVETIVKRLSDGKLFCIEWSRPSTENSGEHEYPDEAYEVKAVPTTVFRYVKVQ